MFVLPRLPRHLYHIRPHLALTMIHILLPRLKQRGLTLLIFRNGLSKTLCLHLYVLPLLLTLAGQESSNLEGGCLSAIRGVV